MTSPLYRVAEGAGRWLHRLVIFPLTSVYLLAIAVGFAALLFSGIRWLASLLGIFEGDPFTWLPE